MLRTYSYENTRQFKRMNSYYLVRYKTVGGADPDRNVLASTRNISAGGILLRTYDEVKPKASLEIEMYMPNIGKTVRVLGEVVRALKVPGTDSYEIGICFKKIEEDVKQSIDSYIREIEDIYLERGWIEHRGDVYKRRI